MPTVSINQLDFHYQILGTGEPLLLIIGLSFSLRDWGTELPALLAQRYQVILFDNRDAGESDRAPQPYTLGDMAADAIGLLDKLGIAAAHVLGVSMGGMIAQHLALNYPDRVNKLILGCTMAGGTCSTYGDVGGFLTTNRLEMLFPSAFIQTHQAKLEQFFADTAPFHSTSDALGRQLNAMSYHDTCDRLHRILAPTLVITGAEDRIIPATNSQFLTAQIAGSKLHVIPDAGHGFCFSHPDIVATIVTDFLTH